MIYCGIKVLSILGLFNFFLNVCLTEYVSSKTIFISTISQLQGDNKSTLNIWRNWHIRSMYISTQNISQFRNHFTLPLKVTLPCESSYWIPLILRSWKLYQAHQTMRVMNWTLDFDIIFSLLLPNIIFIRNIFFVHVWVWLLDKEASWAVNEKLTFKTHMWNLDFRTLLLKSLGNK